MSRMGPSTDAPVGLGCESDGEGVRAGDAGSFAGGGVGCWAEASGTTLSSVVLCEGEE